MYDEKKVLAQKDYFINIIFCIFCIIICVLAYSFLYIYIGVTYTLILTCIFGYVAFSTYYNMKKIIEEFIDENIRIGINNYIISQKTKESCTKEEDK